VISFRGGIFSRPSGSLRRFCRLSRSDLAHAHLSAFRTDELETLQKVYTRLTRLDADLLERACSRARQRTIPEIVFLLQQLHDERSL